MQRCAYAYYVVNYCWFKLFLTDVYRLCGWKLYEDSVELQSFFIQQRDEVCRRGEVLLTPALNFTGEQLTELVEDERRERMSKEQGDEDDRKKHATSSSAVVKAASAQVCLSYRDVFCSLHLQ